MSFSPSYDSHHGDASTAMDASPGSYADNTVSGISAPGGTIPHVAPGDMPSQAGGFSASRKGPNWAAIAIISVLHVFIFIGLLSMNYSVGRAEKPRPITRFALTEPVVPEPELSPPAAPPLVLSAEPNVPDRIAAPVPAVRLTTQNRTATVPDFAPLNTAPAIVAAPPAQVPAKAAPAPFVAPDFRASQLKNPGPSYPYLSRKSREEGVVTLRVLVSRNGRAQTLNVEKSSGHDRLDKAALATVRKWKFVPATQGGQPVEAWVLVPVTFSLG